MDNLKVPALFFGFSITNSLEQQLRALPPERLGLFISPANPEETISLQKVSYQNLDYLGKIITGELSVVRMELLLENIKSMIAKFLPGVSLETGAFVLFPILPYQEIHNLTK